MKLSVIVPVYNEEQTIAPVLNRLLAIEIASEIVVVDDGSTDGTAARLDAYAQRPGVVLVRHARNRGKGAAVRTGLTQVSGDAVVFQDADLEYAPEDLIPMWRVMEAGRADAVYGSRYGGSVRQVDTFWHRFGNRVLTGFSNFVNNVSLTDMETGYKMVRTELLRAMDLKCPCFGMEVEITAKLARKRCRIWEVPIHYEARRSNEGKKIGWCDGVRAIGFIVRFGFSR